MNHCDLLALLYEGPAASKIKSFAARLQQVNFTGYPLAIRLLTLVPMRCSNSVSW
jgi:hypothetical protein